MRLIDADELLEKHTCDVYGAYDDSCMLKAVFVPYIKGAPTVDAVEVVRRNWIPVSERLPEEHDSMFAKWYDTPLWKPGMFRTTSGDVLVCVEFGEGSRVVSTARTNAGEWNISSIFSGKVTHWMPLPELPNEDDNPVRQSAK